MTHLIGQRVRLRSLDEGAKFYTLLTERRGTVLDKATGIGGIVVKFDGEEATRCVAPNVLVRWLP